MANHPLPMLGFVAPSGTGKTTLLRKLVPVLRERGLHLAYLKHTHHAVELDRPGKDSYEIAAAGAGQVMLVSSGGWTLMDRRAGAESELRHLAARFDAAADLLLVEGFHHCRYPKIEVYRPASGRAPLYPDDGDVVAVVTDSPLPGGAHPPRLPLEDPPAVADFIIQGLTDGRFSGDDPLDSLFDCLARMRASGSQARASVRIGNRFWIAPPAIGVEPRREQLLACSLADAVSGAEPDAPAESGAAAGTDDAGPHLKQDPEQNLERHAEPGLELELAIHRRIYGQQPNRRAILQLLGPYSMAGAFAGRDFQPVDAEGERRLGSVPVLSIDGADIERSAAQIAETLADYPLCLVAGHGAYLCAAELEQALRWAELLELSAAIYVIARQTSV